MSLKNIKKYALTVKGFLFQILEDKNTAIPCAELTIITEANYEKNSKKRIMVNHAR